MNWKREAEFRRLLSGQIKHLTKDGLETLAHIATTDMTESYKAVPALAVHKAKRVESTGPGRLHALRILDAIIAKSRQRHGSKDKFVPRIEAVKAAQTIFAAVSECAQEQKIKAAKILQVWRKNNIFAPPTLAASEDALGMDALLAQADSSAAATPAGRTRETSAVTSVHSLKPPSPAPFAPASQPPASLTTASVSNSEQNPLARPGSALNSTQLPPVATAPRSATVEPYTPAARLAHPEITLPSAARAGKSAFPPGLPGAGLPGPPVRQPLYAPTTTAATRASPQPPPAGAAAPGAPPLPAEGVAPFQAGVDAVVLPSGATLRNPNGGRSKQRRSKFDQPAVSRAAVGSGPGSNGSVETLARIGSGSGAADAAAPRPPATVSLRESSRPVVSAIRGLPSESLPGPPDLTTMRPPGGISAPGSQPRQLRAATAAHVAAVPTSALTPPASSGHPHDPNTSPSDPMVSRIRSSLATLRNDLDSKRSASTSQSPSAMPPPLPHKHSAPPLPPPRLDSTPTESPLQPPPSRSGPPKTLPLPPVPTAASVPGIPGLLAKAPTVAAPAAATLPPPPRVAAVPSFSTVQPQQPPAATPDPAATVPSVPPAWPPPPAPAEPAPPGLLEAMPPVPSLTGPASIEVQPPPSFGEVWIPRENAVQPATAPKPSPLPADAPAPSPAPAAPPPPNSKDARASWGQHAWGQAGLHQEGAATMPSGASHDVPPTRAAPVPQVPQHSQYQHTAGPPAGHWGQQMHAGHAHPQPPYHRPPPPAPAMPRHRFSAPPLGLPFPPRVPGAPPGAPPQPPTLAPPPGPLIPPRFPSSHAPPSMPVAYNPFAAHSPHVGPPSHHDAGPRPHSAGSHPPLARPPPPKDAQPSWPPPVPDAAAVPPPPPMHAGATVPQAAPRPYDPLAAAAEAQRSQPSHPANLHGHGGAGWHGNGSAPGPAPPTPSVPLHPPPAAGGARAVNGTVAKHDAGVEETDTGDAGGHDGAQDGPDRKRRRSRWDEKSEAEAAMTAD